MQEEHSIELLKLLRSVWEQMHEEVKREDDAAEFLTLSVASLRRYRMQESGGPVCVQLGEGRVGYLKSDLIEWLHSRRKVRGLKEGAGI